MKPKILTGSIFFMFTVISIIFLVRNKEQEYISYLEIIPSKFEISVRVTGELQSEYSNSILAPKELSSTTIRISNLRIQDLIPEGTLVDSGDYVATLDRTELDNTLKELEDILETVKSQYKRTQLDTTITLGGLRDNIVSLNYNIEERLLVLEQSVFEPPATIRQAEIELEKAERNLTQTLDNYNHRLTQATISMDEIENELIRQQRGYRELQNILENFVIYAPRSGMVIYHREWNGSKRTVGSNINIRDLIVATLPDLSSLISITYVNEIDIDKVKIGQPVIVGVDAFPDKNLKGTVISVSNVGEQLNNLDAKLFEVKIKLNENDDVLKPSMTTSNTIINKTVNESISIPFEAFYTENNNSYVHKLDGSIQQITLGEFNTTHVLIYGLEVGDKILL